MKKKDDRQYARDSEGTWVNAKTECSKRKREYFCECPEKHRLMLVKPSGLPEIRPIRDHFRHFPDKTGTKPTCRSCGESREHILAKHMLREKYGQYTFKTWSCKKCKKADVWKPPADGQVKIEVTSTDRLWRYDCMVVEDNRPVFALEVYHTHMTSAEKVDMTRNDGLGIAEFSADEILNMKDGECLTNFLCQTIECQDCRNIRTLKEQYQQWQDEIYEASNPNDFDYWDFWWTNESLKRKMLHKTVFERAVLILACKEFILHKGSRLEFGNIVHDKIVFHKFGYTFYDDNENVNGYLGILLNNSQQHIMGLLNEAMRLKIDQEHVFFVWAGTIVERIKLSKFNTRMELKDCKYHILKEFEELYRHCSYCLKFGHGANNCYKKSNEQMAWSKKSRY